MKENTIGNSPPGFYWSQYKDHVDWYMIQIVRYPLNIKTAFMIDDGNVKQEIDEDDWFKYQHLIKVEKPQ